MQSNSIKILSFLFIIYSMFVCLQSRLIKWQMIKARANNEEKILVQIKLNGLERNSKSKSLLFPPMPNKT